MPDTIISVAHAGTTVSLLPRMARVLLRGDPAELGAAFHLDLPTAPCTAREGSQSVLWLGPDEWLVLASDTTEWPEWEGEHAAAIEIGNRQVGLRIDGRGAADALAVACPLDLAQDAFPVGMCTRTVFGKAEIVLWRREPHVFQIEVWRSFARYVQDLLAEGVRDLG